MSTENVISIQISPEDKTAIENAIRTLEEKLPPYVVALTPAQRRDLPKMKDKTLPFVEKSVSIDIKVKLLGIRSSEVGIITGKVQIESVDEISS